MKKTLFVALMVFAGIANAGGCYEGAYKFADMINNMHKLGFSRNSIESKLKELGMGPNVIQVGNQYSSILYRGEPKGGWSNGEYKNLAGAFASNACSK